VVGERPFHPILPEERGAGSNIISPPVPRDGVIGNEIDDIFSLNSRLPVDRFIGIGRKHLHDFPIGPVRIDYPFDSGSGSSNGGFREKAYGFSPVSNAI
jgi:hypothetical protein